MDELQQLLGPLDTRSVIQFREFVWGMRTEQSPCGVVVCLDAMLEAAGRFSSHAPGVV